MSSGKSGSGRLNSRHRAAAVLCAAVLAISTGTPIAAGPQATTSPEYVWKANFLARSANFVDWLDDSPLQAADAFRWCVFGNFSFGTTLAELTRDIVKDGKKSEVKWIHKEADLGSCQIIFVSRSEERNYAKALDAARAGRALTVGETPSFLEAGGMMALLMEGTSPGFEVNLEAVQAARLRVSSRLLVLARRAVNHSATGKG